MDTKINLFKKISITLLMTWVLLPQGFSTIDYGVFNNPKLGLPNPGSFFVRLYVVFHPETASTIETLSQKLKLFQKLKNNSEEPNLFQEISTLFSNDSNVTEIFSTLANRNNGVPEETLDPNDLAFCNDFNLLDCNLRLRLPWPVITKMYLLLYPENLQFLQNIHGQFRYGNDPKLVSDELTAIILQDYYLVSIAFDSDETDETGKTDEISWQGICESIDKITGNS